MDFIDFEAECDDEYDSDDEFNIFDIDNNAI